MSTIFRILLHLVQAALALLAIYFVAQYLLWIFDVSAEPDPDSNSVVMSAVACGVVSAALSPTLWIPGKSKGGSVPALSPSGSFDRVSEQPPGPPQPTRPGGVGFEPMNAAGAPAPPASSYGQPSGPGYGAQPSSGGVSPTTPQQGDTPWGNR